MPACACRYSPEARVLKLDMSPGWADVQMYLASHEHVTVVISSFFEWQLGLMSRVNGLPFAWPRSLAALHDKGSWPAATNSTVAQWRGMIEELVANGTRRVYVLKPSVSYYEPWHFGNQTDCANSPEFSGDPSFWNMGEATRCTCCGADPKRSLGIGQRVCTGSSMLAGTCSGEY